MRFVTIKFTAMNEKELAYIDERIDRYTRALTEVILTELQEIKTNIKQMNETTQKLCEWQAAHQMAHDTKDKSSDVTLRTIGVIIAFVGMISGMFFGFEKMNRKVDIIRSNYETQERYLQWKFGETPVNPTTRGSPLDFSKINLKDTSNGRNN